MLRYGLERKDLDKNGKGMPRSSEVDLYQRHALTDLQKDADAAFATGGVMRRLMKARRADLVRFLGSSVHSVEAAIAPDDVPARSTRRFT